MELFEHIKNNLVFESDVFKSVFLYGNIRLPEHIQFRAAFFLQQSLQR